MWDLFLHRLRRTTASVSPVLLGGGVAVSAAISPYVIATIKNATGAGQSGVSLSPSIVWSLVAGVVVGFILLALQARAEYQKRTYDPTWVLKFEDIFNSPKMWRIRAKAAQSLKDHANDLQNDKLTLHSLEDVLDFLEDLGFYTQGDQISPEVAHHAFFNWIQGYYLSSRLYIEEAQRSNPLVWERIHGLFEIAFAVEKERAKHDAKKTLSKREIDSFLDDEISLPKDHEA